MVGIQVIKMDIKTVQSFPYETLPYLYAAELEEHYIEWYDGPVLGVVIWNNDLYYYFYFDDAQPGRIYLILELNKTFKDFFKNLYIEWKSINTENSNTFSKLYFENDNQLNFDELTYIPIAWTKFVNN